MRKYGLLLVQLLVVFGLVLGGCFKGEQSLKKTGITEEVDALEKVGTGEIDPVPETDLVDTVDTEQVADLPVETVERQLYLLDASGMVVPQVLELPKDESKAVATQVLTYLIKDGPVTGLLPNGFQAVLPVDTEILGMNLLEDGTLIVDLSDEFKNYQAEDELKIIEAMTYTLTQFEKVERIKLRINGVDQNEMPVNGTPISEGYSRAQGINIYVDERPDLNNSEVVTMYYPKIYNETSYYVPVTRYLNTKDGKIDRLIVQALLDSPVYDLNITDVFNDETVLLNDPEILGGVLQLEFNEHILLDQEQAIIADEVMETLVRTFSGQAHIQAVEVKVENQTHIKDESGQIYSTPVTTNSYETKIKM